MFLVRYRVVNAGPLRVKWPISEEDGDALLKRARALAAAGDDRLFSLRFSAAIRAYSEVMSSPILGRAMGGGYSKAPSAYGLARAYAGLGDFSQALRWLAVYPREIGPGCGNCWDGQMDEIHVLQLVWQAAQGEPEQAGRRLRRIAAGDFPPRKSLYGADTKEWQKRTAAMEARLVLGELLLSVGKREEGLKSLRELVSSCPASSHQHAVRLARSRLRLSM
jgi:tetratricopeptide (TPR) repeat protein